MKLRSPKKNLLQVEKYLASICSAKEICEDDVQEWNDRTSNEETFFSRGDRGMKKGEKEKQVHNPHEA